MASQSKHSLFLAALKTMLQGVQAGALYWNTLTVVRAPAFRDEYLDATVDSGVIAFMIPALLAPTVATFGGSDATILAEARINLLIAKRYEDGDDPFDPPEVDRWEWQDRLRQDLERVIFGDRGADDTALNLKLDAIEMSAEDTFHETWAVIFASVIAELQWTVATP